MSFKLVNNEISDNLCATASTENSVIIKDTKKIDQNHEVQFCAAGLVCARCPLPIQYLELRQAAAGVQCTHLSQHETSHFIV